METIGERFERTTMSAGKTSSIIDIQVLVISEWITGRWIPPSTSVTKRSYDVSSLSIHFGRPAVLDRVIGSSRSQMNFTETLRCQ